MCVFAYATFFNIIPYNNANTQLQQYYAFVLSVCVCVHVCVCKSSATEAHNFPTCGIGGEGLVKVETNYTTPHPRIKSINKSQKQQGQQQRKQEQQRQPMERGKRKKKEKRTVHSPPAFIFPSALGPQKLSAQHI